MRLWPEISKGLSLLTVNQEVAVMQRWPLLEVPLYLHNLYRVKYHSKMSISCCWVYHICIHKVFLVLQKAHFVLVCSIVLVLIINTLILNVWSTIWTDGRKLHFYRLFYLLYIVYPANYFVVKIRKHDKDFSIIILILLQRNANITLKICRYIRL